MKIKIQEGIAVRDIIGCVFEDESASSYLVIAINEKTITTMGYYGGQEVISVNRECVEGEGDYKEVVLQAKENTDEWKGMLYATFFDRMANDLVRSCMILAVFKEIGIAKDVVKKLEERINSLKPYKKKEKEASEAWKKYNEIQEELKKRNTIDESIKKLSEQIKLLIELMEEKKSKKITNPPAPEFGKKKEDD